MILVKTSCLRQLVSGTAVLSFGLFAALSIPATALAQSPKAAETIGEGTVDQPAVGPKPSLALIRAPIE
jgi:hypothetical protein